MHSRLHACSFHVLTANIPRTLAVQTHQHNEHSFKHLGPCRRDGGCLLGCCLQLLQLLSLRLLELYITRSILQALIMRLRRQTPSSIPSRIIIGRSTCPKATKTELVLIIPHTIPSNGFFAKSERSFRNYTVSPRKKDPDIFSCNSSKHYPTFTIFGTNITEGLSWFIFSPHLNSVSALPGKHRSTEIGTLISAVHNMWPAKKPGRIVPKSVNSGPKMSVVTRDVFYEPKIRPKCVSGRGSAPDPAGGAHDAPPYP